MSKFSENARRAVVGGVFVSAGVLALSGPAAAQCEASTADAAECTTSVGGQGSPGTGTGTGVESAGSEVLGTTQVRGQTLPLTGSESLWTAGGGAALVLLGGALIVRSKSASAEA